MTLGAALREALTLGERVDLAFGTQSLTALQRALLEEAGVLPLSDANGDAGARAQACSEITSLELVACLRAYVA